MTARVDLYSAYAHFTDTVMDAIRKDTFGIDIGQNSWTTVDEYSRFITWIDLDDNQRVLEVACGSGGPAIHLARTTGCRVAGIDNNASAIATACEMAAKSGVADQVRFVVADASAALPFEPGTFNAIVCIDAINHLPNRLAVLRDWRRVLCDGGHALFTDPVVITGPVTSDELALRSSIGPFLFVPPGANERLIDQAGFRLVRRDDVTENAAVIADRWHRARLARKDDLIRIEGPDRFDGLQRFFETVHTLSSQRRLSRIAYVMEKDAVSPVASRKPAVRS